jgi:predicted phage tail protein
MPHMGNNQGQGSRSTMFNGPVNPTEQGNPIPILCGKKVLFGAQVIAADEEYVNLV